MASAAGARRDGRIDTVAVVEAPEHIAFRFEVAGPFQRAAAYLIDVVARAAIMLGGAFLLGVFSAVGADDAAPSSGVLLLLWFGVEWFYHVLLEWKFDGQTLGKRAIGLRVVRTGGTPITATEALLRNLMRVADWLPPPFYMVGVLVSAADARFRRIGDLVADTMVVVDRTGALGAPARAEPVPEELVESLPARMPFDAEERRVIDALVRRTRPIGRLRMAEICDDYADALADRLGVKRPRDSVQFVHAVHERLRRQDGAGRGGR